MIFQLIFQCCQLINTDSSFKMDDKLEMDRFGKFGYESVKKFVFIPYIYRNNEECCATKIFLWHFKKQNVKLNPNLLDFSFMKGYEMYRDEVSLMNEINEWHNDSMYPHKFNQKDTLMKMEDVRSVFKFIEDCTQKSKFGDQFKMKANMVQIDLTKSKQNIILPYVSTNDKKFVPVAVLCTIHDVPTTLAETNLSGIDVLYMRFLLNILKINISNAKFEIPCVVLEELVKFLTRNDDNFGYKDNYWPLKGNKSDIKSSTNMDDKGKNNDLQLPISTHKKSNKKVEELKVNKIAKWRMKNFENK